MKRYFSGIMAGLILFTAGCSKSGEQKNGGDGIKLMFIGQITDTANTTPRPEALAGVRAAIASINASGGIRGKRLNLIICDDRGDANQATKCARKAVRENVAATVGNNSNFGSAILAVLERGNVASIGHLPITQSDFSSPVAFPLQAGSAGMIAGAARLLASQDAKQVGLAAVDSPAGSLNEKFANAGVKGTETKVGELTLVPLDAPDYAGYVKKVTSSGDAVLLGMNSDQAGRFLQAMYEAGAKQPVAVTVGALPPDLIARLGPAAEGRFITAPLRPIEAGGKSNDQYLADLAAHQPNTNRNVFSQGGWLAVQAFAAAMTTKQVEDFSPQNVLAAMNSLEGLVVGDMIPSLTTTKKLDPPYNRLFINKVMFARVVNGKIELLNNDWHPTLAQ
ncbi:ABC transporter substrate-binding protein [Parasphingorhabdus sp.]|uniref:ABC transporter substrate-binding protein n=1 Tax=Parasphingorhabdus sp. TaxID=2709688 RepID=UPI003BAEB22D